MTKVDRNSKIAITVSASALIAIFSLVMKAYGYMSDMQVTVEKLSVEGYTKTEASEQALRHAIANPGVKVPDPRNPGQYFHVQKDTH